MWEISWIAVIVAALAGFMVGGVWYGPLFLKIWQKEAGITEADIQARHPARVFGGAFILNLFSAFFLGHVLATYGNPTAGISVMIAGGIALAFIVPAFGVNYLFAGKSMTLLAVDGGYWLVIYSLMGLVFGLL
jgi:hypothetical protein